MNRVVINLSCTCHRMVTIFKQSRLNLPTIMVEATLANSRQQYNPPLLANGFLKKIKSRVEAKKGIIESVTKYSYPTEVILNQWFLPELCRVIKQEA